MSGIVDTWTNEVAKLREKGRTIGSSPGGDQSRQVDGITKEGNLLSGKLSSLIQYMKDKSLKVVHSSNSANQLSLDPRSAAGCCGDGDAGSAATTVEERRRREAGRFGGGERGGERWKPSPALRSWLLLTSLASMLLRRRRCSSAVVAALPPSLQHPAADIGSKLSWLAELDEWLSWLGDLDEVAIFDWMRCNTQHVGACKFFSHYRFLKLYDWTRRFGDPTNISKVHLPFGLNSLPNGLRYLNWHGYPSKVLPSNLSLENLIELELFDSNVEQLWEGKKNVPRLKRLILGHSQQLTRIPDLSGSPYLEVIDLVDCRSLLDISSSIQHLNNLNYLRLKGCESLRSFSRDVYFESLKDLDLSSCINLMKFPQISGSIKILNLNRSEIEEIPSSVEGLTNLISLDVSDCSRLKHISINICKVKSLRYLYLKNCSKLEYFPEILETMERLETLDLSGTAIKELPLSIEHLNGPLKLFLRGCKNLETLPSGISNLASLIELDLSDCSNLDKLPVNMGNLTSLENLSAGRAMNCKQLQSLPNTSEFAEFITSERNTWRNTSLTKLDFMFTNSPKLNEKAFSNVFAESLQIIKQMATKYQKEVRVSICYPGSKIPEWFCYQSHRSSVNIQLSPHNCSNRKFLGLALCAVIAFKGYCYTGEFSVGVPYVCCFQTDCGDRVTYKGELTFHADRNYKESIFINSDHVILGYHEYSHGKLSMDDLASFKVMFKAPEDSSPRIPLRGFSKIEDLFRGLDTSQSCRLKYCGVCPIYAEPEIIQTSISDEKFDSINQDLVPDPKTIPEKKLTLFINNRVVPFYRISCDKVFLWLFYCWIFLVCLFCGLCVFGMLVFLVLQLSARCETYLSSHVQNTLGK
ncbi:hypothetical protein LWI29_012313 [Acer saccharum]|uniref:Uncharacterized protein n=1 Tax=Acer saccharum TaxID=4024 RepID=A0AA39RW80_ACESA|nr:hypothetical protein LWI29_012313 [Acer saccharum]